MSAGKTAYTKFTHASNINPHIVLANDILLQAAINLLGTAWCRDIEMRGNSVVLELVLLARCHSYTCGAGHYHPYIPQQNVYILDC